tara:strand:- start:66 stop:641 length:576 start_codon:yes stop_codon:yes gene_type:complete
MKINIKSNSVTRKIEKSNLFSTPIWRAPSKLPEGAFEWALKYKESNRSSIRSARGGYQSSPKSFDDLPSVYAHHIFDTLKVILKGVGFELGGWWLNVNQKGDFNMKHTHPNHDLSGIWYITDNNNTLVFTDPLTHSRDALYNSFNDMREGLLIDAKAGEIILFPSDVPHHVEPHPYDTTRISVSFNILLKG